MSNIEKRESAHELFRAQRVWELKKEKIQFFFGMGLVVVLLGLGVCAVVLAFPAPVLLCALGAIGLAFRRSIAYVMKND